MGMIWLLAVIAWAAAEASFFFILPDVLLTFIALRYGWRPTLKLAAAAAVAASLTGCLLWLWGSEQIWQARAVMTLIPAIDTDLVNRAYREMIAPLWPLNMLLGAITGVPYKLYAVEAGAAQIGLLPFLIASFLARFLRFAGTILLVLIAKALLVRLGQERLIYPGWAMAWIIVYAVYFGIRGF